MCKQQYVGKIETTFNIHLNNHRKDAKLEKSASCEHEEKLEIHEKTRKPLDFKTKIFIPRWFKSRIK